MATGAGAAAAAGGAGGGVWDSATADAATRQTGVNFRIEIMSLCLFLKFPGPGATFEPSRLFLVPYV